MSKEIFIWSEVIQTLNTMSFAQMTTTDVLMKTTTSELTIIKKKETNGLSNLTELDIQSDQKLLQITTYLLPTMVQINMAMTMMWDATHMSKKEMLGLFMVSTITYQNNKSY